MSYPDYPDNRIILIQDGTEVDLTVRFQLILLDDYKLNPPEPKTYSVDIPGGDGNIDLTEALMGDTAYKNRNQEFTMVVPDLEDEHTFEERKTEVSNYIHGRAFDYRLTMDPGYIYHGRFTIEENSHTAYSSGILGSFKIKVDANPYKSKGKLTFHLNATGGKMFRLPSGRKKVHPVIECTRPCSVQFDNKVTRFGAGSYRLNDVLFEEGYNNIYINSYELNSVIWSELAKGKPLALTWADAKQKRWDDIQRLNYDTPNAPRSWKDLMTTKRWTDLATTKWTEIDFRVNTVPDTSIIFQYDWKDL